MTESGLTYWSTLLSGGVYQSEFEPILPRMTRESTISTRESS